MVWHPRPGTNLEDRKAQKIDTVIGPETTIRGSLSGAGGARVDGRVEGEITLDGDLIIGETGSVQADVRARNVIVAGAVRGNVECEGALELASTGQLYGDVKVRSLSVRQGAILCGNTTMPGEPGRDEAPAGGPADQATATVKRSE